MKSFNYSLEKVLNLRKHYEDEAKIELGRAIGVLAELESRIFAVVAEIARAQAAQFSPENNAVQLQQYMFYLIRLDNTKERLLHEAALAEMKVEEAREAYLEASKERKVMDNHKDKCWKDYRKLSSREETKIRDDANVKRA
ncbi:MAG: flagellar export protein FliJ [Treponema sp.]|jgi:flagellar FliJ protein|nr:flagellar export protein FliJ [Treponema sp.]